MRDVCGGGRGSVELGLRVCTEVRCAGGAGATTVRGVGGKRAGHEAVAARALLGIGIQQVCASTASGNEGPASGDTSHRRRSPVKSPRWCR